MPGQGEVSRSPRRLSSCAASVLTFVAAASVLVLEIAAGRLLAPFVGISLNTYTGIIGVILAGIALGAWLGGRAADRFGPEPLLGPALLAGGLSAMASVAAVAVAGPVSRGNDLGTIVLLAVVGFFVPSTILSSVAPMIVRATLRDVETSGALVGRLSAIGTAGGITGTFLTGFVLLGAVPTRLLILAVGGAIVIVGLAVSWWLGRSRAAVVVGLAAVIAAGALTWSLPNPCERESRYYCISVRPDPAFPQGRILVLDNLWHAFVDLADPSRIQFGYVRWFAASAAPVVAARGADLTALHLGGGGFSFPRYLRTLEPASRHTILELDPEILRVGREELGFRPDDRMTVVLGDARLSIESQRDDAFDLVVGDAFGGLSVPWHLTTSEFLAQVDRVLRPDGRYLMNVIDGPALRFVRAETATLRRTFEHVAVIGLPQVLAPDGFGGNIVLVASHGPFDVAEIASVSRDLGEPMASIAGDAALNDFVRGAPTLTDDFAPVDQLIGQ